jgi:hypothetical protein
MLDETTIDERNVVVVKREDFVRGWLTELSDARKREKEFRRDGHDLVLLYEGGRAGHPFNILYSNTETWGPALYNAVPRPVVQRRFKDTDPLGAIAAKTGQRALEYLLDDGLADYPSFDELMKSAVLEALVPGRGVTRFKYDATIEQVPAEQPDAPATERVSYEAICGQDVPWDRFLHGYAKRWKDVPWVAYEWFFSREELLKNFGPIGALVPVMELEQETTNDEEEGSSVTANRAETQNSTKVAQIYEIWDKASKTVIFISTGYADAPLKVVPDPLGLSGFFDCPKPISFVSKISTLVPVALYKLYEEQAQELNKITTRINKLIGALKVRGMYDSQVEGLEKVLEAEDNTLIPAQNVAALLSNGNALEKAIWLLPIEKLVAVLQQLYLQRVQVKQVIYEITGIADIMRGSTQASETLGAQQLKNQWGTLRLKRLQKEVARYARDSLRLMLEIAVTKLAPETLKAMTGLPYPTGMEKQQAAATAQSLAIGGQQPPPELVQALQQPSWDDILGLLRNDLQRSFRIDIETNSTVDAEATEDKENIAELLNAMSQFLNGIAPLVESGAMPFDVAQGMLLAIVRRFRFGPELEDMLKGMKPPEPKPDPKAAAMQQQAALDQQQGQLDLQMKQLELAAKQREAQAREQEMALEASYKAQEHAMKMEELRRKGELSLLQHHMKVEQARLPRPAPAARQ